MEPNCASSTTDRQRPLRGVLNFLMSLMLASFSFAGLLWPEGSRAFTLGTPEDLGFSDEFKELHSAFRDYQSYYDQISGLCSKVFAMARDPKAKGLNNPLHILRAPSRSEFERIEGAQVQIDEFPKGDIQSLELLAERALSQSFRQYYFDRFSEDVLDMDFRSALLDREQVFVTKLASLLFEGGPEIQFFSGHYRAAFSALGFVGAIHSQQGQILLFESGYCE